jgi:ABC-type molybdate transport system ATPase subunit
LKIPILYVTHLAAEVERLADAVVEIANGRVVGPSRKG